jgi:hypothetical protein
VPLTPKDAELQLKLTLAVLRNSWPSAVAGNPLQGSAGLPQFEARFDVAARAFSVYAVGHVDRKDGDGRGEGDPDAGNLTGFALEAGFKLNLLPLTLMANGYFGKAMAHQFGNLTQFGDITGFGAWGQVGFDATPNLGVYAFVGFDRPDEDDVRAEVPILTPPVPAGLPKLMNLQAAAMVRYKVGPYQIGLEYLIDRLTFADGATSDDAVTGNQIALSVNYGF